MSLTQNILDQHAAPGHPAGAAGTTFVCPDLLLADRETSRLVLGRFAAIGGGLSAIDFLVASDRPGVPAWSGGDPTFSEFQRVTLESGARLVPPRGGDRAVLALESLAAPGRLFATLGPAPEAGALGALVLPVGELEALTLLRGEPLEIEPAPAHRIELSGELPSRCDGHDVAGALLASHPAGWSGMRLEIAGAGVSALSIDDRIALCRALVAAGAESVLFPSDDRSREFLRARGRDADWRRTDPGPAGDGAREFDLGWTVPHAISCERPTRAVPLAWWAGVAVASVDVGPGLTLESLARFHALLRGRSVHPEISVRVRAWSALDGTSPESAELRLAIAAAGARWIGEATLAPWFKRSGSLRLCCGLPVAPPDADEDDWWVSLSAAAESACRGLVETPQRWSDPRELEFAPGPVRIPAPLPGARESAAGAAREATAAGAAGESSPSAAARGRKRGTRAESRPAGLRGPVLGRLDGNLEGDALLFMGPKLAEWVADPWRLAEHAVPAARSGNPGLKAGAAGGWLIVLGEVRGVEGREAGLLALGALGVRAVLAAGFEARARTLFSRAGLLALRVLRASDLDTIQLGDELELVGGLEAFAPDRARVVRDLTRAFAVVALPEQSSREWHWVSSGGAELLAAPRGRGPC